MPPKLTSKIQKAIDNFDKEVLSVISCIDIKKSEVNSKIAGIISKIDETIKTIESDAKSEK